MARRDISLIVIHCAAVPNGRWTSTLDIDHWHRQAGFRRSADASARYNPQLAHIGYHWVIYINGGRATGRSVDEVGAHARGFNARSIGICLVGTDQFSQAQWEALADQVRHLCACHGIPLQLASAANGWRGVCGHRDTGANRICPGFSVAEWIAGDLAPLAAHVLAPPATPAALNDDEARE